MQIGIGAFKFQNVISSEMQQNRDKTHKTHIQAQYRKSIQDKCKKEYQNTKKKKMSKLHENEDTNREIQIPEKVTSSSSSDELAHIQTMRKEKQNEFVLQVSDPSSSDSFDSELNDKGIMDRNTVENYYQEECMQASQNIRFLTQQTNKQQILSNTQISQTKKQTIMKVLKQQMPKKDIEFLRSLCQNQNLINNDSTNLDEYKIDRTIYIDMDCKEINTFMRLQHEVEEMRRKQNDFNKQKELHYEIVKDKPKSTYSKQSTKSEENKLWTLMMAKRFIKNMKLKTDSQEQQEQVQQEHLLSVQQPQPLPTTLKRKSTRASQIKNN